MTKHSNKIFVIVIVFLLLAYGLILYVGFSKFNLWRHNASIYLLSESHKETNTKKSFVYLLEANILNSSEETFLLIGDKAEKAGYDNLANYYYKKTSTTEGFYKLGNLFYKKGQYDNAEKAYQNALDKKPDQNILLALTKIHLKKGELDSARDKLESISTSVISSQEILFYKDLVNLLDSKQLLINVEDLNPQTEELRDIMQTISPQARINLLYQFLLGNDYPQLGFEFLKSRSNAGQLNRDGYLLLANDYFLRKDYVKSYQALLLAKAIDQYYPQTYQHLAEVAELLNKQVEANQYRDFYQMITW